MKSMARDTVQGGYQLDDLMNLADVMASSAATLSRSQQNYDSFVQARDELKERLKNIFKA